MKILMVAPYYAPRIGGLENYARNVTRGLAARGHSVVVVTSGTGRFTTRHDVVDGIRVVRLATWLTASNTPVNPLWLAQLHAIVRRERPDVILAHTPVPFIADMASRAAGSLPFVLTYHNDLAKDAGVQRAIVAAYWRTLGAGTLERADRIIATSRFYADTSPFLQPYAAKTEVIAPGVDLDRFHAGVEPAPIRAELADRQLVLFVGSLARSHAHKGLDLLLEAVARLRRDNPAIHLLVVGRGDGRQAHEARATTLGIQDAVTFTGFVPDDELPGYYAAADVFVLPSTTMAEGFGMVLLEASACGTAVIGTSVGGIPAALAAAGSAYLAEPTVASIAQMVRTALSTTGPGDEQGARSLASWDDAAALTEAALLAARRPRVALIHNVVSPYRLAMFDELSKDVNLRVLFTQAAGKGRLWSTHLDRHGFDGRRLRSMALGPIVYNPGGWRRLRRSRFQVLVTNTDPDTAPLSVAGLALARLRRRPVVVWSEVTDTVVSSFPSLAYATSGPRVGIAKLINAAVLEYRKAFFSRASAHLAFSDAARAFLLRNGVRDRDVVRTYEVVPADQLPEPKQVHARDGRTFLYVGYLNQRKNVALLVDAFRDLPEPDARLLIVGSGPEEQALRRRAQKDGRIEFWGYAEGQAKAEVYASSDVLVLPTRHDCWGLVVNEAIHYGLAVIVTDTAAASELVGSSRGLVVPSGDRHALTAAMARLLREPGVLKAMQATNRGAACVSDVVGAVQPFTTAIRRVVS
jgi:glycosyltransferase involved in cell wall biosynthesis